MNGKPNDVNDANDTSTHSRRADDGGSSAYPEEPVFDYTHVDKPARIACYDDLRAAPRIIEIQPNTTTEFIENLASSIYEQSHIMGGSIAYTAIREVTENFIHARFEEIVVSILDGGNTIRFADQGPGIPQKDKALLPGFSSATEPMKRYIRGVGSGFPLTTEYIEASHGSITIEDNLKCGAVITLSLVQHEDKPQAQPISASAAKSVQPVGPLVREAAPARALVPPLTDRERLFIPYFLSEGALGVTDLVKLTGTPQSSTYVVLKKLEEEGIIEKTAGQKRILTDFGFQIASNLSQQG